MIKFDCDYLEGTHPKILDALVKTNMEQTLGYGVDDYCSKAKQLIKEACDAPDADVHLLVGGTQTNALVISSALRPYQGVVAVESGHINVHEVSTSWTIGYFKYILNMMTVLMHYNIPRLVRMRKIRRDRMPSCEVYLF